MSNAQHATIYYGGFAFRGGGAFMHAKVLRTELQRAGWDVKLVTLESLPLPIRFVPHAVGKIVNRLNPPMGYYWKDRLTRFLYQRLFNRDDHLRVFEDVYLAWNSSVPSVTVLHAVWSDNLQSISADAAAVKRLVKSEERLIDAIMHPIMAVSHKYRDLLVRSHGGSSRLPQIAVVPLGVDLSDFEIDGQAHRSAKSLVHCGSLEPRKNLKFFLGVFRSLHRMDGDYRLTLIGDGPDQADLKRYVSKHGLPVIFRGWLRREDVVAELRQHSLYVHPSVKESFSFALLEGKLAGLTTIAYEGLEVPSEFIDVPVASFDPADWLAAIRCADAAGSKAIDADAYSSRRMMMDTLSLAKSVS